MTLLADGRLHFDNNLKASWSDPILSDIPTYAQYLQWVDEPREDKDQEPDEPVPPRVYTEEEVAQFHAELVRLHQQRRGLLVLDLDHTLVHCTRKKDNAGNAPSFTIGQEVWFFDFRPGLVQFLQTLSPYFEIHLYTFATRPYAEHLINAISSLMPDPNQMRFRTLFTRNECLDKKRKSISEMFPDNSMVLVVDDNKGAVWTENDNLIKIPPYYHFGKKAKRSPNDQHLIVVSSFLKTYHHIFFEQRTCETKHILAKMRELAAIMCPLDLVAIEKEREKRKEKHRDSERKKEEKAQKVREKAERERLRREKEQQQLSVVISGQQYAHVQPMQFMASGEMSHTAPCRVAPTVQAAPVMQLQQPYPSPPTALSPPVTLHVQSGAQPRLPVPCAVHPRGAASSPTSTEAVEEKHSPPRNNLAPNFLHQEDSSQSLPCAMTPHPSPLPNRPNLSPPAMIPSGTADQDMKTMQRPTQGPQLLQVPSQRTCSGFGAAPPLDSTETNNVGNVQSPLAEVLVNVNNVVEN
uniref:protein-serine/threonine phosphatase n=1 Tax=Eutreptiella gymnastica TaxID=73025 RepID=A0A7S4FH70_9EUGL